MNGKEENMTEEEFNYCEEMERRKQEADIKDMQTEREERIEKLAEHIFDDLLMNFDPEEAPSGRLSGSQRDDLRMKAYELAEERIEEDEWQEKIKTKAEIYAKPLDITYGGSFVRTTEEVKNAYVEGAEAEHFLPDGTSKDRRIKELEAEVKRLRMKIKELRGRK